MNSPAVDPTPSTGPVPKARKLIVCIDGTSNQFSEKNTNVVELYSRIKKDSTQLTYYNSGIGTYARPFWWSFAYLKQQFSNTIDLMIAWNFDQVIIGAYRWLADTYEPGDQIFLFGFSRGAYQVRTLAGMIETVGLIYPGNQEQIPFAWEIYSNGDRTSTKLKFKEAFCREKVDLHFVGVWDTVASVGVLPRKPFPLSNKCRHITHFRHALALDECRVKFLPEHISDLPTCSRGQTLEQVWFVGTHSDIGGGNKANPTLDRGGEPLKWMMEEAQTQGLSVRLHDVKIGVPHAQVTESMRGFLYLVLEAVPFLFWRKYLPSGKFKSKRWPHWMRPREVLPGQSIHWTVGASLDEDSIDRSADPTKRYSPKAKVLGFNGEELKWTNIKPNKRGLGEPNWADESQFTLMVNILKKEFLLASDEWFSKLHDYTCGTNRGQPDAIWAYGGPQLLNRLFKTHPTDPKTTQITRSIIGYDPDLPWNGLEEVRKPVTQDARDEKEKKMIERLRDMVLPRVALLLQQWAASPSKSEAESDDEPESETDSVSELESEPQPSRWAQVLGLFGLKSSNLIESDPVGAKWNLDRVSKEDRSNDLARAIVDLVTDITKTKYILIVEEASAKLAILVAGLMSCLTVVNDDELIETAADWEEDKAVLAEGVLNAVEALFKYDASRDPFYTGGTGHKLRPLIRANQKYPNLALRAMGMVALLSRDHSCGSDISESKIVPELLMLMRDDDQIKDSQMGQLLANEALATTLVLSEHVYCGLELADEENLDILFKLLESQARVDDVLRILYNISKDHADHFFSIRIGPLARQMRQNIDASLTLVHIAVHPVGLFGMDLLEAYSQEGVISTAVEYLNHPQEIQVLTAARLLRALIDQEADLRRPLVEDGKPYVVLSEVSEALTTSLQVPSRSNEVIQEMLATAVRLTLHDPIPADQFALLASLASAGNKLAMLAVLAAASHSEHYQKSISQFVLTVVEMVNPEEDQFLKESMEVLASLVNKGFVLPDSYLKSVVESAARIVGSAYPGSISVSTGQSITTIIALKLLEGLCANSVARNYVAEAGVLRTIILDSGGDFMGYNSHEIENHANAMLDRLSRYNDLDIHIERLRGEKKESDLKGKGKLQDNYGVPSESEFEETSPLFGRN